VLRNGSKSALATYRRNDATFVRIEKQTCYGISPRNAEQSFALQALMDDDIKLVTLSGTAGTGKTLLALAAALECRQRYRQIMLARPVVPLSNRDLGFLPGDIGDKLDPYMQPLYDNLTVIRHQCGQPPFPLPRPAPQCILRLR
jgi:PhoH-like ATPase